MEDVYVVRLYLYGTSASGMDILLKISYTHEMGRWSFCYDTTTMIWWMNLVVREHLSYHRSTTVRLCRPVIVQKWSHYFIFFVLGKISSKLSKRYTEEIVQIMKNRINAAKYHNNISCNHIIDFFGSYWFIPNHYLLIVYKFFVEVIMRD